MLLETCQGAQGKLGQKMWEVKQKRGKERWQRRSCWTWLLIKTVEHKYLKKNKIRKHTDGLGCSTVTKYANLLLCWAPNTQVENPFFFCRKMAPTFVIHPSNFFLILPSYFICYPSSFAIHFHLSFFTLNPSPIILHPLSSTLHSSCATFVKKLAYLV